LGLRAGLGEELFLSLLGFASSIGVGLGAALLLGAFLRVPYLLCLSSRDTAFRFFQCFPEFGLRATLLLHLPGTWLSCGLGCPGYSPRHQAQDRDDSVRTSCAGRVNRSRHELPPFRFDVRPRPRVSSSRSLTKADPCWDRLLCFPWPPPGRQSWRSGRPRRAAQPTRGSSRKSHGCAWPDS